MQDNASLKIDDNNLAERSSITLPSLISKYHRSRASDKGFVALLTAGLVVGAIISAFIGWYFDGTKGIALAVSAAISGIIVGISFSIIDRIGFAAPIEDRLYDLLQENQQINLELQKTVVETKNYTKYNNTRNRFGINDVKGRLNRNATGDVFIERGSDEFAIDLFNEAKPGSLIRYMNTFMESADKYYHAISDAIERGVHIRLLMMKADTDSPAFINRYTDCLQHIFPDRSPLSLINMINSHLDNIASLEATRRRLIACGKHPGQFELRCYWKSLNFPMLLLSESGNEDHIPDVAYTGFYGSISSESMPYIEWRGGEFRAIRRFKDVFDGKWKQCEPYSPPE
jgi:hypothetical protein